MSDTDLKALSDDELATQLAAATATRDATMKNGVKHPNELPALHAVQKQVAAMTLEQKRRAQKS